MSVFIYSPVNPIRLIEQKTFDSRYNSVPFDFQGPTVPYYQKYQTNDTVQLQVLADHVPTLTIRQSATTAIKSTITPTVSTIIGQTYSLYEFKIQWTSLQADNYYVQVDCNGVTYQSDNIQTANYWPNTALFEYTHSKNTYSIIFSTGYIGTFRAEACVQDFNPEFSDVIYADQTHNITKLNSIRYRTFNLYVPGFNFGQGVPQWVGDRINWIFGCDQLQIDGQYYQNNENSKWEITRTDPDGTRNIGLKLNIIEVADTFTLSLNTGASPAQTFKIVSKALSYPNISANFNIAGTFNNGTRINTVSVNNRGAAFNMQIGITSGGSEIMVSDVVQAGGNTFTLEYLFIDTETIYLTIPTGSNCDVYIDYTDFNAPSITPGSVTTVTKFPPYAMWPVWMSSAQMSYYFDLTTGLGKTGTEYAGTAIVDGTGRNGTPNNIGLSVPMIYKQGAKYSDIGMVVTGNPEIPIGATFGESTHTLTAGELPPLKVALPGAVNGNSGNAIPFAYLQNPPASNVNLNVTDMSGNTLAGSAHNNIQPTVYCVYVMQLPS